MYISAGSILNKINSKKNYDLNSIMELSELKDDDYVKECLIEISSYVIHGLSNLINLYNPEIVILGGAVPKALPGIVELVRESIQTHIFNNLALETPIYISQVNNETNNLGSIALVIQKHIKAFDS